MIPVVARPSKGVPGRHVDHRQYRQPGIFPEQAQRNLQWIATLPQAVITASAAG